MLEFGNVNYFYYLCNPIRNDIRKTSRITVLARILDATENMDFFTVDDQLYSVAAIDHRVDELLKEFLEPYVIDNALKGD